MTLSSEISGEKENSEKNELCNVIPDNVTSDDVIPDNVTPDNVIPDNVIPDNFEPVEKNAFSST